MTLTLYEKKRDFAVTPEPKAGTPKRHSSPTFVVQKHVASKLHYDLRLEIDGVLKSWALPKGPSLDPEVKRLAVQVEDHPFAYKDFEGSIPDGEYGAGEVIVWDTGPYETGGGEAAMRKGLKNGRLTFILRGKKLRGGFSLFRFRGTRQWLLRKRVDKYASAVDPTRDTHSVLSERTLADPVQQKRKTS
ncbi:MAG TPA: DNA polymerase ligase N-terminal domain-containing protein [Candidatus Paceibacterota bacterium]|nr:DNA polymerase ligase N-terminal domain-containing protein [Candidatus Paceibacterota bacterium]